MALMLENTFRELLTSMVEQAISGIMSLISRLSLFWVQKSTGPTSVSSM